VALEGQEVILDLQPQVLVVLEAVADGIKQVLLEIHPLQVLHKEQTVVMDK
tara:strand:- start:276 stop:428 length:153 start_codon:yes stop_codon:yes gene_type:complete